MSRPSTAAIQHVYPLRPLQRGMLFHCVYEKDSRDYQEQVVFRLRGELDPQRLRAAFDASMQRHESLRSAFVWQSEREQVAVVFKPEFVKLPLQTLDWSERSGPQQVQSLRELLAEDHAKGYNLKRPPLARLYLIDLGQDAHYCVFSHHHLILDGWSLAILLREVLEHYESGSTGATQDLAPVWEAYRAYSRQASSSRQAKAWTQALGEDVGTKLPGMRSENTGDGQAKELRLSLTQQQREAWEQGCRKLKVTPSSLLQAAYALALGRATGQSSVGLGVTLSGRPSHVPGVEKLVGLLINTLPLAVRLDPQQDSHRFVAQVARQNLWLQEHQCAPLSEIQSWTRQSPLFETVVVYDNYPVQSLLEASERAASQGRLQTLTLSEQEHAALGPQAAQRNHYPLTLVAMPGQESWWLGAAFDRARIKESAVRAVLDSVAQIGCALVETPRPLGQIRWRSDAVLATKTQPLPSLESPRDWSVAPESKKADRALLELGPEGSRELSWGELELAVARARTRLLEAGVQREDRVLLDLDRSLDWVITFLAIQSAGACAVPVDPAAPLARKQALGHDCGARWVVGQTQQVDALNFLDAAALWAPLPGALREMPEGLHPENLAYLLYTSGSTGAPKGVGVTHRNWGSYAAGFWEALELEPGLCCAWLSGSAVDLGHSSILAALQSYGSLAIVHPDLAGDPDGLSAALRGAEVDLLKIAPTQLRALMDASQDPAGLLPRRALVSGGEALSETLVARVQGLKPGMRVLNHYGPTETTVGVALAKSGVLDNPRCIGSAMPHAELAVRDPWGQVMPEGLSGELWISGQSVARGYYGDPRKTAQCFVPDPAGTHPGARAYRSGDRVCREREGLCFEGRIDRQLKIRGFRVEPAELEAWLRATMKVSSAMVFAEPIPEGQKPRSLWAVLVRGEATPTLEALKAQCAAQFPALLVPSRWKLVDALPLLASGKVDRARVILEAQEKPEAPRAEVKTTTITDPVALQIAEIWSKVLKQEIKDPNANFFTLGGDSILSLQVVARARKAGLSLVPKDLFEHPTVARLAQRVSGKKDEASQPTSAPGPRTCEMLPAEAWMAAQELENPGHFYQSMVVALKERPEQDRFGAALKVIGARHPKLSAALGEDAWVELGSWGDAKTRDEISAHCQRLQRGLGQKGAPKLRLICFVPENPAQVKDGEAAAWLGALAHHEVVDAVSWRVLLRELSLLMQGSALPKLPVDAHAFAQTLHEKVKRRDFDAELDYWLRQTRAKPLARERSFNKDFVSKSLVLAEDTSQLLTKKLMAVHRAGVQESLLCALSCAMAKQGEPELVVELEGHGRGWSETLDASNTVAWCTARYPMRLEAKPDTLESLSMILDAVYARPGDGSGYGALRYLSAHKDALAAQEHLDLTFNYLGQADGAQGTSLAHPAGLDPKQRPDLGPQRCPSWKPKVALRCTASVREGRLAIRLDADPKRWSAASLDQILSAMRETLESLAGSVHSQAPSRFHRRDLPRWREMALGHGEHGLDAQLVTMQASELGRVHDLYPAGANQIALWLQDQKQRNSGDRAYWNQFVVGWKDISAERLVQAFSELCVRHPILRTAFVRDASFGLLQVELEAPKLPVAHIEIEAGSEADERETFGALASQRTLLRTPVADAGILPWELLLAQGGEGRVWMAFTRHHILLDGWSTAALLKEFASLLEGQPLDAVGPSYREHIAWEMRKDPAQSKAFWSRTLEGVEPMPAAMGHNLQEASQRQRGREVVQGHIDAQTLAGLAAKGAGEGITLNLWCQAAWARVLSVYSGRDDLAFGVVDSGRDPELQGSERIIGLLMQTLPLALRLREHATRGELMKHLQGLNLAMREHGARGMHPRARGLWSSLLVFENYPLEDKLASALGQVRSVERREETHYPLALSVDALGVQGKAVKLSLRYDRAHYSADLAQSILGFFVRVLEDLAQQSLEDALLGLGSPSLRMQTPETPMVEHGLVSEIEAAARANPEVVALVQTDGARLCYGELIERVHIQARGLRERGVGFETPVGICLARGNDLVVATLAVLAAGGYYVPIDPELPLVRQRELCDRAKLLGVIVAEPDSLELGTRTWSVETLNAVGSGVHPLPEILGGQLAYQIFTSGSTGVPKGVGVEHRQVLRLVRTLCRTLELGPQDTWTMFHRHAFDVSVWEIFGALCSGAKLVVIDERVQRDPVRYAQCLCKHKVTVASETPSAFYLLQAAMLDRPELLPSSLRHILFAGEALDVSKLKPLAPGKATRRYWDLYGNTETTVHATLGLVKEQPHSVGRALDDMRVEVLSPRGESLPAGAVGELYIAGAGVTRGYLDNPRETAQRFVPDPKGQPGARCYRSGDLASQNDRGDLYYVGRVDRQVQLRGFRIELAEVESRISALCQGRRVCVLMQGEGELARLLAFVEDPAASQDTAALRASLESELPDYQRPSQLLALPRFALTANGKLDQRRLLEQARGEGEQTQEPLEVTPLLRTITEVWQEVLGRHDLMGMPPQRSFFELGGHSLLAVSMLNRLASVTGTRVELADFLRTPTRTELEALLSSDHSESPAPSADALDALLDELIEDEENTPS